MSYTVYMLSCNFVIHVTCSLTFTTYKYTEFQVFGAIQKLSRKAICKTPLFL